MSPTPETVVCGFFELLAPDKCSSVMGFFMRDISIFALVIGLVLAYFSYRFYRNHDLSESGRNKVEMILLVSVASIMIIGGIIPKPVTVLSGVRPVNDISVSPVYEKDGEMVLRVSNRGYRAINVSKFTVYYGPPNWEPVRYSVIESQVSEWAVGEGNQCFTSNMSANSDMKTNIMKPGEWVNCSTGIKFPGKNEEVEIRVEAKYMDLSWKYTCSVESSSVRSC